MSRSGRWKARLVDMQEACEKIISYCVDLKSSEDLARDSKTFDACVRNLQILGDAAKNIPAKIQKDIREIPWKEIKGMRNIVVHEYFGTSPKIVWKTIKKDLPKLLQNLKSLNEKFNKPTHPWRICAPGETYVRSTFVRPYMREGHPVSGHPRRDTCRESESSRDDILSSEEVTEIAQAFFQKLDEKLSTNDLGFRNGNAYDSFILGWTKYWNDIFQPDIPLDPSVVKALIASESSFNPKSGDRTRKAKGLMQLMPATIRYLRGEKGELKNHIFEFTTKDLFDPNFNIAMGIRWLFRKRETASARLKRAATWRETVAEYKDYLRRKLKNKSVRQKGMENFDQYMEKLSTNDDGGQK